MTDPAGASSIDAAPQCMNHHRRRSASPCRSGPNTASSIPSTGCSANEADANRAAFDRRWPRIPDRSEHRRTLFCTKAPGDRFGGARPCTRHDETALRVPQHIGPESLSIDLPQRRQPPPITWRSSCPSQPASSCSAVSSSRPEPCSSARMSPSSAWRCRCTSPERPRWVHAEPGPPASHPAYAVLRHCRHSLLHCTSAHR